MKKSTFLTGLLIICTLLLQTNGKLFGQEKSPRMILLEQFTNTSCGPCADENPAIINLYNSNTSKMCMIFYHVNWPGANDPFYVANTTEQSTTWSYYGVTGVPHSCIDGVKKSVSQTNINTAANVSSPFTITMTHSVSGGEITVNMTITRTASTTGTLTARIAVIEKKVTYSTAPGNNGEKVFYHAFRKFLPNRTGTTVTLAVNESTTITQKWTYANILDINQLAAVGFIQDNSSKVVYQAAMSTLGSIPLTANFTATPTSTCDGNVQFTDNSSSNPTSWSWNFGDGTTSSLQNPSHKYSASGKYTVSLTASKTGENDSETKTDYITVNKLANPTAQDGGGYPGSTVTLTATGTGTLKWYDVTTGGTVLGTGTTFVTPPLTQDKTYYVEAATGGIISKVGKAAQGAGGYLATNGTARGLVFDVLKPIILKSVKVYSQTAGNRVIQVLDAPKTGNEIASTTVNIPTGEQVVTLNLSLPAGTNYHLKVKDGGTLDLWRDNAGASYPYNISDLVSIKYSNTDDPIEDYTYYYFFYDWSVAEPECASDRTPCIANIWTTGINENETAGVPQIYPSPVKSSFNINLDLVAKTDIKVHLINTLGKTVYEYSVHNVDQLRHSVDVSSLPAGIYMVQVVYNDECFTNKIIKE